MKNIGKSLLLFLLVSSTFFLGFWMGREKEKKKIPNFQEDYEY
ncbi:MAG: hypothetical protein AB1410_04575 [Acidobacteriota bacterium]